MSDWKESIPGIVIVTILLLLGEFIDKRTVHRYRSYLYGGIDTYVHAP